MYRDTDQMTLKHRIGTGLAALVIACAGTSVALGQDDYPDDWEYEPGEGYHEQEWYDPSDWFDSEDGVDYEYDTYDYDYNDWGTTQDGTYDGIYDYNYYDDFYSAYYDGYYDGYYDDQYGYDDESVVADDTIYSDGYVDGYYDGFYDQVENYDYDPYYYIVTTSVTDRDRTSDRQRRQDDTRQRGDRSQSMAKSERMGSQSEARERVAQEHRRSAKIRGTIENISYVRGSSAQDDQAMIVRVRMQDGKTARLNLGPKMSKSRLPFEEGDRVTFTGTLKTDDSGRHLRTDTITADGDTVRIASRPDHPRGTRNVQRTDGSRADVNFSGRVADLRRMDLGFERYLVVRVNLEDKSMRHIAIKSDKHDSLTDLGLNRGDRIEVRGQRKMIDDRRVVVANRLRVNGEAVTLSMR